mgnify:CR=1 FL=1
MQLFRTFNLPSKFLGSALAIGNFDGVHEGHLAVINKTKEIAKSNNTKLGVLTFEPHPKCFFKKQFENFRLTKFREKFLIFKDLKIDFMINIKFDKSFVNITAEDFIKTKLVEDLKVNHVITGFDFVFGNKKSGDVELIKNFSKKTKKFNFFEVPEIKNKNSEISSSVIRGLLGTGKIAEANKMLKRNWSINANVIQGEKNGRRIGFKTANLDINSYCSIAFGVYLVKIKIPKLCKNSFFGIANYGVKPTFDNHSPLLEVHIFNFNRNIYNVRIRVEFLNFIRHEKKFESLEKLRDQIIKDIKQAKNDRLFQNN